MPLRRETRRGTGSGHSAGRTPWPARCGPSSGLAFSSASSSRCSWSTPDPVEHLEHLDEGRLRRRIAVVRPPRELKRGATVADVFGGADTRAEAPTVFPLEIGPHEVWVDVGHWVLIPDVKS